MTVTFQEKSGRYVIQRPAAAAGLLALIVPDSAQSGRARQTQSIAVSAVADLVRRLHLCSLVHKDLYLCHLFVKKGGDELSLIDLARVERTCSKRLRVKDLAAGTQTLNAFRAVQYDLGLKEQIFSERFLRRPPREVMR